MVSFSELFIDKSRLNAKSRVIMSSVTLRKSMFISSAALLVSILIFTVGFNQQHPVAIDAQDAQDGETADVVIRRIEPNIPSLTVRTGSEVKLSVTVYGDQNKAENSLADSDAVSFAWNANGGDLDESTDRKATYTAPDVPGTFTVDVEVSPCIGTSAQCSAEFELKVLRTMGGSDSGTGDPCAISGTVPAAVADSEGTQYAVFTAAEGGTFSGDGFDVTAGPDVINSCEYIGIRADNDGRAVNRPQYRYTLDGDIYSVTAVDASGSVISDYAFNDPARVCLPVPPSLTGNITELLMVVVNSRGDLTPLTGGLRTVPNGAPRVCGNVSSLPSDLAIGKRGVPPTPTPVPPTPTPELPNAGGNAVPYNWAVIAMIFGLAIVLLGATVAFSRRSDTRKNLL